MMNSFKMDSSAAASFNSRESKNGIMDDRGHDQHCLENVSDLSDDSSVVSSESDLFEEVNSSSSSSPTSSPTSVQLASAGPLQDMSSLLQDLPFKRGLSKHYNGKSQSFTSLSNVRCLEDLAKPENPYNKKLKSCRSYGGLLESHGSSNQPSRSSSSSRLISKKASRGSCSSLCVKRNPSFLGTRPPVPPPPHRSSSRSSFTARTPLFALGV